MKKILILLAITLSSCSSTHLVSNWKNPEIALFDAYKVLIVGMTQNEIAREKFETKMKKEFSVRGIESVRSIDVFDVEFTTSEQSEEKLSEVEQQLLNKDFDAILFTKVIGSESRRTLKSKMMEYDEFYDNFHDDYLGHQGIYYDSDYYGEYKVYHSETSLYCICAGKERELIWKGSIDITDPVNINKTVEDYVRLIVLALGEQDIIFRKKEKNEVTGL